VRLPWSAFWRSYPEWIARHRVAIVAGAAVLAAVAAALAFTLPIRTEFSQLLPDREPSVLALRQLAARKASTAVIEIGIASADPEAARRFAAGLARELRTLPKGLVHEVDDDDMPLRSFLWKHRFLYAPEADLKTAVAAARAVYAARNPLYVPLEDPDPRPLEELSARIADLRTRTVDRPPGHVGEDGHLRMIVVRAPFSDTEPRKAEVLLQALEAKALLLLPSHPGVEVGYAGDPVTAALEHALVLRDVAVTAGLCSVLVIGALVVAFRSPRLVVALGANLLVACSLTFGWARLAIGQLNSATAFLGSVVAGNGINFGIILVARYREERCLRSHPQALAAAIRETAGPTLVASVAAGASYLSLVVTEFRGFSEFGAIAGVGMLVCWMTTFAVLPALLDLLEPPSAPGGKTPVVPIPGAVTSVAILLGVAMLTIAGTRFLHEPFEDDLGTLRSRSLPSSEVGKWSRRLDASFGRVRSGGFVLGVEHPEDMSLVLEALDRAEEGVAPEARVLGKIDALPRVLPGTAEEQRRKIELLTEARNLLRRALPRLDEAARERVRPLLDDGPLRVLGAEDLPPLLRDAFTEKDGRVGLLLVVHPGPAFEGWSHRGIRRAVALVGRLRFDRPLRGPLYVAGPEVLFVDMMRAVERDAPRATIAAALLVVALLAAALGFGRHLAASLVSLAAGMGVMLGAMALFHVRLNFLSVVAIPITMGIGIDYPFNVIARLKAERERGGNPRRAMRQIGGAVALCSATTMIGYFVLLFSDTGAIRSFGLVAVLGELACLLAALLVAPAALVLLRAIVPRSR
jgi:predicted exporter